MYENHTSLNHDCNLELAYPNKIIAKTPINFSS